MGTRRFALWAFALLSIFGIGSIFSLELAPYSLPGKLYPSREYVTVSGGGSGGIMAQNMHFSFSKTIKGAAVYSTTFYRCGPADGNLEHFGEVCMLGAGTNQYPVDQVVKELDSYQTNHVIDSLGNLRDSYLYVYVDLEDEAISTYQELLIVELYERYLGSPFYIKTRAQGTADAFSVIDTSSESFGKSCSKTPEADGTVDKACTNMSTPAEALEFLLGRKYPNFINPFYRQRYNNHLEPLRSFNQSEFTEGLQNHGMDEVGYLYVPKYCQQRSQSYKNQYGKPCPLHVYFHGCGQAREFEGTTHVMQSNYLEVAEANSIIVLFPQILSSETNKIGCWDYNGITGMLFATKKGVQVTAVWRMIARLLSIPTEESSSTTYRAGSSKYTNNRNTQKGQKSYPSYPTTNNFNRSGAYRGGMQPPPSSSSSPPPPPPPSPPSTPTYKEKAAERSARF